MTDCSKREFQNMTPEQKEALDFMLAMRDQFGDFSYRVVTPAFVAVSPGVNPDVPLGEKVSASSAAPAGSMGRARAALKGRK
ncbi:hypothetical protein ACKF11_08950 [Methylobacillus sp. Pita2]|uniref:hypothetical protein n=1 Tax=Methylobacillus sp. Pita2 TaxID=3383245 RepID=UPI0038B5AACE